MPNFKHPSRGRKTGYSRKFLSKDANPLLLMRLRNNGKVLTTEEARKINDKAKKDKKDK